MLSECVTTRNSIKATTLPCAPPLRTLRNPILIPGYIVNFVRLLYRFWRTIPTVVVQCVDLLDDPTHRVKVRKHTKTRNSYPKAYFRLYLISRTKMMSSNVFEEETVDSVAVRINVLRQKWNLSCIYLCREPLISGHKN